jgi:cytochrome P450
LQDVSSLKYAAMVANETLRMQPVVPTLGRRVIKDTKIGAYQIPEGVCHYYMIY